MRKGRIIAEDFEEAKKSVAKKADETIAIE